VKQSPTWCHVKAGKDGDAKAASGCGIGQMRLGRSCGGLLLACKKIQNKKPTGDVPHRMEDGVLQASMKRQKRNLAAHKSCLK
jgi:hypothetical protein